MNMTRHSAWVQGGVMKCLDLSDQQYKKHKHIKFAVTLSHFLVSQFLLKLLWVYSGGILNAGLLLVIECFYTVVLVLLSTGCFWMLVPPLLVLWLWLKMTLYFYSDSVINTAVHSPQCKVVRFILTSSSLKWKQNRL